MKRLLIPLLAFHTFPYVYSFHLNNERGLLATSESTKESIELAKSLKIMLSSNIKHIGDLIALIKVNIW